MKWYILVQLEVYQETDTIGEYGQPERQLETIWQLCHAENFSEAMKDLENFWGDDIVSVKEMKYLSDLPVMLPANSIDWIKEKNDF